VDGEGWGGVFLMTAEPNRSVHCFAGVRKGALVVVPYKTSLDPPVHGGKVEASASAAEAETIGNTPRLEQARDAPSPWTGRAGEGSSLAAVQPIESLRPGDRVFGHDGLAHRVSNVTSRPYQGTMIGVRTNESGKFFWMTRDDYVLCSKRTTGYGAGCSWKHVPIHHFSRAKAMRKEMTAAERALWRALRRTSLGVEFRRQHPVGPYIVDFYSRSTALVVEVDGDSHFTNEAQGYDQERTNYLEELGLSVLRFTNLQVLKELSAVVETVRHAATAVVPADEHPLEWRRADSLRPGDVIYRPAILSDASKSGIERVLSIDGRTLALFPTEIREIASKEMSETVYDLEVDGCGSFVTEVCVVRNCDGPPAPTDLHPPLPRL
jgi:very-short-patch-repair endonuclease